MAVKPPVPPSIGRLHGAATEATKRFSADAVQRRAAAESPASIILNVKDVQGEYDGGRLLETTLGGAKRASPESAIEKDGLDSNGPRFRIAEGVTCGQIAALATCLYVLSVEKVERAIDWAASFRVLARGGILRV